MLVATVYDLFVANYGIDQGLGGRDVATSYDDDVPYTPAWQEAITGVKREDAISVARQFAQNAHKTQGKSMVIVGAGINHWFHMDMTYRAIINMLIMCGCVGKSGGGWSHYVGQEKLRPQTGWTALAFALDWHRPPRQMNSTSFFYAHTDQWRYDPMDPAALLSPLADKSRFHGAPIDYNVRAERMGWLPCAPQLAANPLRVGADIADPAHAGAEIARRLASGELKMACEDPDAPENFPRNLFVWRSNLLGSSGKGHEYFLKHLLGTAHGVQGDEIREGGGVRRPEEVTWHADAPRGKLDLLVTLDFRMSTTCMYSDVVLPTATWYEKDDMNTSDMHPFIHPLSAAVDPAWQSKSDWEIFKGIAKRFSELAGGHLGIERDVVLAPIAHDSAAELAQPFDVRDWKRGECDAVPGRTMPAVTVVDRDYPSTYRKYTSLGPLMERLGNGGKGIGWDAKDEVALLGALNYRVTEAGCAQGRPRIDSALDAAEVILALAPETNGAVAVKAWQALSAITGLEHAHLARARGREDPLSRPPGAAAQDHLVADVERDRIRARVVQRGLCERARARAVAHAERPAAALSGSSVDARVRRGALRVQAADRHRQLCAHGRPALERPSGDRAELHHAAPEMGHPQHVHGQPADAHAVARRADRLDLGARRAGDRRRRQRLDRVLQRERRAVRARGRQPARAARHGDDVSRAGEDREHAGLGNHRHARRHP